jgi:hypothetical protein
MLKIAAAGATVLCAGILCTTPYSLNVTPQGSVSLSMDSAAAWTRHHRVYHPVARAAAVATGAGYYGAGFGGWGGWGWNRPLFASAVGVGGPGVGMIGGAFCYPTFDYSTGWNAFCPGTGFAFGTGNRPAQ